MSANSAAVNAISCRSADLHARPTPKLPSRRALLASTALLLVTQTAGARTLAGGTGAALSPHARGSRCVLPRHLRRQAVRAASRRREGPDHHRNGERLSAIARDERDAVFRDIAAGHALWLLRRPGLWRQSRHGS